MIAERRSVLHSWCRQLDWNAPTVVGGNGAHLHLEDGRTILDMSSLSECSNLGHQHPRVVAAIREQAAKLCFVTNAWGAGPRAELAGPAALLIRLRWRGQILRVLGVEDDPRVPDRVVLRCEGQSA